MEYSHILLEYVDSYATITIDRPKSLNALNFESLSEIKNALIKCLENDSVSSIVFKGAGDKAFVAGADIKELKEKDMISMLKNEGFQDLFNFIDEYEKPTIAAIDGLALGGGCELALACDIRVATEASIFALPELNLSIIPAAGGTQRLAKLVGAGNALYMILTGKKVTAKEAKEMGLVNEVVAKENLEEVVNDITKNLANKSSIALKLAKISVKKGVDASNDVGLILEKISQALLFTTEDKKEGMESFIEKRKPNFVGK
ncbi:enoyl-CoA hydratase/isomerase family protein [Oceanobacillus sp. CAU 1775]